MDTVKAPESEHINQQAIIDRLQSFQDKTDELFEEEDYIDEAIVSDLHQALEIKVGTKLLAGYKNIKMVNKEKIENNEDDDDLEALDKLPKLDALIDELTVLTEKKVEAKAFKFIPENLQCAVSKQTGQLLSVDDSLGKRDLTVFKDEKKSENALQLFSKSEQARLGAIYIDKIKKIVKPRWHAPWKLKKVIVGHKGWVRCLDFDTSNEWFVTGSNDRTIKFWDLASTKLKLSLTGHIGAVRDLKVDPRHTYLYSCGEDKTVRCWDLVQNKAIRNYHGHLSGVYTLGIHPTLNLIASGGRDSTVRLWDIRTKYQVQCFEGHTDTVQSIIMQEFEPQIVSGSSDQTVRLWDIGTGKRVKVLTNHKKGVRSLAFHPTEYTFCSSGDKLKVWKCPEGRFLRNFTGHNAIVNSIAINEDNVLVSAADNGSMYMWDWKSGYNFQQINSKPQPGSISSEAGIFDAKFDHSGLRLVTVECDKTIKIWGEDEEATPETHPIDPNFREFVKHSQS